MSDLVRVVNRHVGRPWCAQGFDCWAFVRAVYAEAFQIFLPVLPAVDAADPLAAAHAVAAAQAGGDWLAVPVPLAGDVVTMSRRTRPHHVGSGPPEDGGRIAHCDRDGGVCCPTVRQLTALGWGGYSAFRHRSAP